MSKIAVEQIEESCKRYTEQVEHPGETEATVDIPVPSFTEEMPVKNLPKATKPVIDIAEEMARPEVKTRLKMIETVSVEPPGFALERAIGNNDSVYSNFVELMVLSKQKVGRIVIKEGSKISGYATGFLVSPRLLLTNWHVFNKKEDVKDSEVEFYYELDVYGREQQPVVFKFKENDFFFSYKEYDYCFIAVAPTDISNKTSLGSLGYFYLDPEQGKLGEEGKEKLNIIHHPEGMRKQLSIRENRYLKKLSNTIWYETDTAQGSSGSPVMNDQWQIVALHHSGVPEMSADGKSYLDKNNKPILPDEDGKIDAALIKWKANEGFRISIILNDFLSKQGSHSLVKQITVPAKEQKIVLYSQVSAIGSMETSTPPFPHNPSNTNKTEMENSTDIRISLPASLMDASGTVNISINNATKGQVNITGKGVNSAPETDGLTDEIKKVEKEDNMDYAAYKGYDENFMGVKVTLPKVSKIKNTIAKFKDNAQKFILTYQYYSSVHSALRKMPVYSAINVEGNPALRKDEEERVDVWLRDNRIEYELQLTDAYYSKSGFDKGHLSRREDADWGPTAAKAKEFADLTCMYTNACPQVPELNRSNKSGLWGMLEKVILEKGVKKEEGRSSRISVFNGPVFKENDKAYKGVMIPMQFWKIIVWLNEADKLKATAFMLSQEELVGDINFDEELQFDQVKEFAEYQCSISEIEKLTKLDFGTLKKVDTYDKKNIKALTKINSTGDIEAFIISQSKK